jgi:hypothetical protein
LTALPAVEVARNKNLLSVAAVALLCYDLVQRPVDMLGLTWGRLYDGTGRQSKGGQRAYFLISPEFTELLEEIKRRSKFALTRDRDRPIVLYEGSGRPYEERHFRKKAGELRAAAGLREELKTGDLRRSGATALTDVGATDSEARSVTGHASIEVFRRHYDVEKAAKAEKAHDNQMAARAALRAARAERRAAEGAALQPLKRIRPRRRPKDPAGANGARAPGASPGWRSAMAEKQERRNRAEEI